MNKLPTIIFVAVCSACSVNSGVVQMNASTYMLSKQAATGFHGMGNLKADAVREARAYCLSKNKELNLIKAEDSEPPYILGNFPKTDIYFSCVKTVGGEIDDAKNPSI